MGRLVGKTCIVTGAGQGIGRSIVERFVREGASVIATDLQLEKLQFADCERIVTLPLDVTDFSAIADVFARYRKIDVLVNCAGYVAAGTILECPHNDFERSMMLNVRAAYWTISTALPAMIENRSGSIINICSVVSSVMAAPSRFAYGTSKAALVGLTMSVARDYASSGIRCNAISPGTVDTPSLSDRLSATGDYESSREAFISRQLLGRLGTADEIASVAAMLASDEAAFMTGSNVIIDGGMSL